MNILIIDDDQLLIDTMVENLDRNSLGVECVFTANNGIEAQEILRVNEVSLIISDIEMPGMNGLELVRWARQQQPDCKSIFLSGHASFSYAKEAIDLQSSQYLLKPVSMEELHTSVARVLADVRNKRPDAREEAIGSRQSLWAEYIEDYRRGSENTEAEKRGAALYRGEERLFAFLVAEPEPDKGENDRHQKNLGYQLMDLAKAAWSEQNADCEAVIFWSRKQWALIGATERTDIGVLAERLIGAIHVKDPNITIFYTENRGKTMTDCVMELNSLSDMALKVIMNEGVGVNVTQWNRRREPELESIYGEWKNKIKSTDQLSELGSRIGETVASECREARVTRTVFVRLRMILSQMLYIWLEQRKLQQYMLFDEDEFKEKYESSIHSLKSMEQFIAWLFERMAGDRYTHSPRSGIVRKIKSYVEEHLSEDMSRKDIANLICLSENYVSTIFSEETGESLPGYIARMRMEKAKEYLRNTDWVVSRISVEVGYTNFSYFSKVFKEYTGKTPNEYRKG